MMDFARRGSAPSLSSSSQSMKGVPLVSILPSVKLTLPIRRRSEHNLPPSNNKPSLLTLSFTSRSFLDSAVEDSVTKDLLYQFETVGTSTTISRTDSQELFVKTASIKWPRFLPTKSGKDYTDGVLIDMNNTRWYGGETLLKLGSNFNAPRKFTIPGYAHPMKWKRYGNTYWCTAMSVKGPIATFNLSKGSEPMKLTIYETFHDKSDSNALPASQGVSLLLLDYLLVTTMLLATDLQEWMLMRKVDSHNLSLPDLNGQGPSSVPFKSDPKFRKFLYGEPIFPKILAVQKSTSLLARSPSNTPSSPGFPTTPTTPDSGMPITPDSGDTLTFPHLEISSQSHNPKTTDSDDDEDEHDAFSHTHPTSPYSESTHFATSSTVPSHTYNETTSYDSESRSLVASLHSQYTKSLPSTPVTGAFPHDAIRLSSSFQELSPRPQHSSSPEMSDLDPMNTNTVSRQESHEDGLPRVIPIAQRSDCIQLSTSTSTSESRSPGRRPLPRPPVPSPIKSNAPIVRHVQSSDQLSNHPGSPNNTLTLPRAQRSLPPTPGSVSTPTTHTYSTNTFSVANSSVLSPMESHYDSHRRDLDLAQHSRQPPISKASQEDLTSWVHQLTSGPERRLPPSPLPNSTIFDMPPPAYNTINFSNRASQLPAPEYPSPLTNESR